MNWGFYIKKIREDRHITQNELAENTGMTRAKLSMIELGKVKTFDLDTVKKLAAGLNMEFHDLCDIVCEVQDSGKSDAPIKLSNIEGHPLTCVRVPIRGYLPAGYPSPMEERIEGYVEVPENMIGSAADVYGLIVSGDSLIGDNIHSGDMVIVEPHAPLIDGKIYVVRIENEVLAKHLYRRDGQLVLKSTNDNYKDILVHTAEILGRVIATFKMQRV